MPTISAMMAALCVTQHPPLDFYADEARQVRLAFPRMKFGLSIPSVYWHEFLCHDERVVVCAPHSPLLLMENPQRRPVVVKDVLEHLVEIGYNRGLVRSVEYHGGMVHVA
jgi:hypothetical protein